MAVLIGSVDQLQRVVVRLDFPGVEDSEASLIDTGFNGQLLASKDVATRLGVEVSALEAEIELGDGRYETVLRGRVQLIWLGTLRLVEVLVVASLARRERRLRRAQAEPLVILGTALLTPNLLLIDFAKGTVEIERQE